MFNGVFILGAVVGVEVAPVAALVAGYERERRRMVAGKGFEGAGSRHHPAERETDVGHEGLTFFSASGMAYLPDGRRRIGKLPRIMTPVGLPSRPAPLARAHGHRGGKQASPLRIVSREQSKRSFTDLFWIVKIWST